MESAPSQPAVAFVYGLPVEPSGGRYRQTLQLFIQVLGFSKAVVGSRAATAVATIENRMQARNAGAFSGLLNESFRQTKRSVDWQDRLAMVFREIVSELIVVAELVANSIVGDGEWAALSGAAEGSFVETCVRDPAKPTKPIFRVPLIDISKLPPAAALQGRLSALAQICDQWSLDDTKHVVRWAHMQRHEIRALKYSDRQSTNLEPRYQPVYDLDDHTARTLEEIAVINRFEPGKIWSDIRGGRLNERLNEISSRAGASGHFRNGSVGTALDSRGQAIVYPSCKNIPSQIAALNAWLIANQDYPVACAAVTMNVIFNMHPFDDKNGRCGRILFNLLCATPLLSNPTIPLYELSVSSQGNYVIALRLAQYRSDWLPFIDTLDVFARFTQKILIQAPVGSDAK